MGVLKFVQGTPTQRLRFDTLTTALQNLQVGAWTVAVLFKRLGTADTDPLVYTIDTLSSAPYLGISVDSNDHPNVDVGTGSHALASNITSTASPYLFVVSKAAGSAVPAISWKLGSGGAWTDDVGDAAVGDVVNAEQLEIGAWMGEADGMNGWIGVIGMWSGAMSTTNKKALDDNWRTSDWWRSEHGRPVFLMEMNVAVASLVDLADNASNQSSTTVPTLDASETLNGWSFDGRGFTTLRTASFERGVLGASVDATDVGSEYAFSDDGKTANSTLTYSNTHCYGTLACEMIHSATPSGCNVTWTLGGGITESWGRIYLHNSGLPNTYSEFARTFQSGNLKWRLAILSSGVLRLRGSFDTDGVVPISINQWIRIEWHVICSTTVGQIEAKLFNSPNSTTPSETITTTATLDIGTAVDVIHFGDLAALNASRTVYMDNIVVNDTGYPGPVSFAFPHKANFEKGTNGSNVIIGDDPSETPWDFVFNNGGTLTYDNTHAYDSLACKIDATAGGAAQTNLEWSNTALTALTEHYGRIYLYLTAFPGAGTRLWVYGIGSFIIVVDGTTGTVGSSLGPSTTTAIALNQWVRIEWHVVHNVSTGSMEIKLFNNPDSAIPTEVTLATGVNSGTGVSALDIGVFSGGSSLAVPFWLDNIGISNQGYLGPAGGGLEGLKLGALSAVGW